MPTGRLADGSLIPQSSARKRETETGNCTGGFLFFYKRPGMGAFLNEDGLGT